MTVILLFTVLWAFGAHVCAQLDTAQPAVQAGIVARHNLYRSGVSPTATNMKKMEWSDTAAKYAQSWANKCNYEHSPDSARPGCGENLAASSGKPGSWNLEAIDPWADERHDYTFGQTSMNTGWWNPKPVGHYTAMVWASSYQVGCGYRYCPAGTGPFGGGSAWHYYVCSYCPAGNLNDANGLTKPYNSGPSCTGCPSGWTTCDNKQCSKPSTVVQQTTTKRPLQTTKPPVGVVCPAECPCTDGGASPCESAAADQWTNCAEMEAEFGICNAEVEGLEGAGDECQTTCLCNKRKWELAGVKGPLVAKIRAFLSKVL